ncbi:hypothetical protein [Oryzifoliimicrobium ureilyticus]|uniref:hypothetical protein n=1 Tax=Oryzifoliimicrobium ureilyticus TaxID=3113724 RepID=UPI003076082F
MAAVKLAFDLELSAPVKLETRPADGWCFGRPPSISAALWPISPVYGTPLRHAFTLRLPELYRTQGDEFVAISLFVDEMFEESELKPAAASSLSFPSMGTNDPKRFDMECLGVHFTLFWLTEEHFKGPLGLPPMIDGKSSTPGWLRKSPLEYFGRYNLPSSALHRPRPSGNAPGAFALQELMASEQPPSGWATLSAIEAMNYVFPIRVSIREGDPNVGRKPSDDADENAQSGYVPIYSDAEGAADLERFAEFDAHLGGTMLPHAGLSRHVALLSRIPRHVWRVRPRWRHCATGLEEYTHRMGELIY